MNKSLGFIGLGVMGYPMAGHLSKDGHSVNVYNRTKEKSQKWSKHFSGRICNSPAELAEDSEIIILCVGKDSDILELIHNDQGIKESIKDNSIIIDHSTTSAELPIKINKQLKSKNITFLDAPVSGGQAGAEAGQLSIMIGGDEESFNQIEDIIKSYSKFTKYMGPSGSGQLTKMVNQICLTGLIQALAEGINFSDEVGLNTKDVIEVISKGAAQSWQMENRWETMINGEYDHGFAVDLMRKDLDIILKKAEKNNIPIDITKVVNNYYKDIQKVGGGRLDTSSLLKRIKDLI
ncbi:MAG: 2-hydroxy-3-oxopropionate reductase [Gammaproteobacteria bacterium]|nr:2-hydroxy-3-oxopropionate reductase [Gammaproteobacteria bacterium]|tara:strand:+ start:13348 stop:14223 length:876 start_codon:yes stop_codon:yes gene_type:complete